MPKLRGSIPLRTTKKWNYHLTLICPKTLLYAVLVEIGWLGFILKDCNSCNQQGSCIPTNIYFWRPGWPTCSQTRVWNRGHLHRRQKAIPPIWLCICWERSLVPFSCRIPDILLVAISSRIPDTGSDNRASLDFITCSFNCSSPGSIPLSAQIDRLMCWHPPTVVAPLLCTSSVYRLCPLHFPPIMSEFVVDYFQWHLNPIGILLQFYKFY